MGNDEFAGLSDSWGERQAREREFRTLRRVAFFIEVVLFNFICLGLGAGAAVAGEVVADAESDAVQRFAYAMVGGWIGGAVGVVRAVLRLGYEGVRGEVTGQDESDPVTTFRWSAWVVGLLAGAVLAGKSVAGPNAAAVGFSSLAAGVLVAAAAWAVGRRLSTVVRRGDPVVRKDGAGDATPPG